MNNPYEKLEDTKSVSRSFKSKNRQYNGQSKEVQTIQWPKQRSTNNTMAKAKKYRQYNGQNKEVQTIQWPKQRNTNKFNVFSSQGSIGYVNYRHHFMSVVVLTVDISEIKKVSLKTGNHLLYWTMLDKILRN